MKKGCARLLVFIACFAVFSSAAFAAEFVVSISPEYQNIMMGDSAVYELTVQNNMDETQNFEIYSPDVTWDVSTIPASDKLLTVEANSKKTTQLQVKPLYVNNGLYGVLLNVRPSGKSMLIKSYVMVGVNDPNPPAGEYLPAVRAIASIGELVDPRQNITIELELENQNRREITELDIKFRSSVINTEYKTGLGPLEKKKITLNIPISPLTKPQEDLLRVTMFTSAAGKTFQYEAAPVVFEVMQYGGLKESRRESKGFLKTTLYITVTNEGNADFIDMYDSGFSWLHRILMSSEPEMKKVKDDGKTYHGWMLSLEPYESETITVVVSYRIPFGLLVAAIVIVILYYIFRSPVVVHKSASVIATKEGGISELKVLIVLKNRSGKAVKRIDAIDKVPHIAEVSKDFEMGSLHPVKVLKHDQKGTLIKWEIAELDKLEERVLAYKIKTKLSVLGQFRLPVVVVKFAKKDGKEHTTRSNAVTLMSS